jgi:hypothetical protein
MAPGPITKPALLINMPVFQQSLGVCAAQNGRVDEGAGARTRAER